jgi:LysM repeat protein
MKRILFFLIFVLTFITSSAQTQQQKTLAEAYLQKYASLAVKEMQRSGVPASITLAQGMLESSYGNSELAVKANNHFGIQCHDDWTGKSYEHMDAGELRQFRQYKSVLESYADHSDFLANKSRYSALFKLDRTDYKAWANGLKQAGYAEDPDYASKLIRMIEMFRLYEYDNVKESPVEAPRQLRTNRYNLSREIFSRNGVPYIYAYAGEKYSDIARQYGLFLSEVLSFNDVAADCEIPSDAVVYIRAKKRKAAKGNDEYVVEEGMGMREISQKFAVKLKRLYRMNSVDEGYVPQVGETIKLR